MNKKCQVFPQSLRFAGDVRAHPLRDTNVNVRINIERSETKKALNRIFSFQHETHDNLERFADAPYVCVCVSVCPPSSYS